VIHVGLARELHAHGNAGGIGLECDLPARRPVRKRIDRLRQRLWRIDRQPAVAAIPRVPREPCQAKRRLIRKVPTQFG